jgi:DNA-binding GntR family transcriptional regulator
VTAPPARLGPAPAVSSFSGPRRVAVRGPMRVMTKGDAAYEEIRARVLRGELEPGTSLDQERLATELGISTTPLREALRRLEAEGWLTASAHRDVRVGLLSVQELNELYEIRFELDPLAAVLAADRLTREGIEELRTLAALPDDPSAIGQLDANRILHRRIYAASGNTVLTETLDRLWDRCDRYRHLLIRDDPTVRTDSSAEHVAIIEALATRRRRLIKTLMRHHLEDSLRRCQRLMNR